MKCNIPTSCFSVDEEVVGQRCCKIGDKTPTYVRKEKGSLSGHFALYKYHERQQTNMLLVYEGSMKDLISQQ